MKPPFSVLVVHGDGSHVLRVLLPRWIVYGALGSLAVLAVAGLSGGYVIRQLDGEELAALRQQVDDQRELIDAFETRVGAVGGEIAAWRALHAEMWKAFGPEEGGDPKPARVDEAAAEGGTLAAAVEPAPLEELDFLATSLAEEEPRRRALERVIGRAGRIVRALPLEWPVHGRVKSEFGLRRSPWNGAREHHAGIDIGSPPGTPVESPAAGTVVEASVQGGLGKHVTLDHGNGVRSRYGHMKKLDVKVGQQVEKGQVIGLVGSTGHSTGPHLHYEVRLAGKPVDPSEFLGER
jgi:murein DD-endopeptidase MepM/ murein hydrolase activator NlpD